MSIDPLGRVIVGSRHFIEKVPGVIAQGANVVVGGGHFHHLTGAVQNVAYNLDQAAGRGLAQLRSSVNAADQEAGRWIRLVEYESRGGAADANDRASYNQEVADRLERLAEAGGDIVEAYGWAASGDLQSAWEKLVDAAQKTAGVAWENATNPPH